MKRCCKNISKVPSLNETALTFKALGLGLAIFIFAMSHAMAGPVALIQSVSGNAFVYSGGKTKSLVPGDTVDDFSEIIIEVGGQVSFADYYNHRFHLSGSGHVRLLKRMVDLKQGYLWIQSSDYGKSLVQTANSKITYTRGELITSFESDTGKTQVLSVKGFVDFANLLQEDVVVTIPEGNFSFIDKNYAEGIPRNPTQIGFNSFKKLTALFPGVSPLTSVDGIISQMKIQDQHDTSSASRKIASLPVASSSEQAGEFIYLKKPEKVKVKKFDPERYTSRLAREVLKTRTKKSFHPPAHYSGKSNVQVNFYGEAARRSPASSKSKASQVRAPASVSSADSMPLHYNPQVEVKQGNAMESSLVNQYKKQMRHTNEVNRLIDELKSFDQDYKKSY